jgi:inner membrane protease subunit 1
MAVVRRLHGRFTRYAVAGESMSPALKPGDFFIVDRRAFTHRPPRAGEVVLAPDPREPARQLVKRVRDSDPVTGAWLEGDNSDASTDSRDFGRAPIASISGRVIWRYWPPRSFGPVP